MGTVAPSLIIANADFNADDLADLKSQSKHLSGARVVHTSAELEAALSPPDLSFVLQLITNPVSDIAPLDVVKRIQAKSPSLPYIAAGKYLSAAYAVDLMYAGASDCMTEIDDRCLHEVLQYVTGPRRRYMKTRDNALANADTGKAYEVLGEGVVTLNPHLHVSFANPALLSYGGYQAGDLTDIPVEKLDAGGLVYQLESCKSSLSGWKGEVAVRKKGGGVFPAWAVITPVFADQDKTELDGFVLLVSDISAQKKHEQEMHHLANFDSLTGLPNRNLLQDRMTQVLNTAKRNETRTAVLFIDLDHFKAVNDTWGHAVGDRLLIEAATRMQDCVRKSDTVARIGGDEFAIILTDVEENQAAVTLAAKISGALERSFVIDGAAIYISASIGIAICPMHGEDPVTLLKAADAAMYEVKRNGRRGYRLYGDRAAVSYAVPASTRLKPAEAEPASSSDAVVCWRDRLRNLVSVKKTLPPIALFPAGVATACLMILFSWMFASGVLVFNFDPSQEQLTATDLNGFGTAAGAEEATDLPELQDLGPK